MVILAVLRICNFTYKVEAFGPQKNIQSHVEPRVQKVVCDVGFSTYYSLVMSKTFQFSTKWFGFR